MTPVDPRPLADIPRRSLRLAAVNGATVPYVEGSPANGEHRRPLTEADIEREVIESIERWEGSLGDESDLKLILTTLGAEFRRRQARRRLRQRPRKAP